MRARAAAAIAASAVCLAGCGGVRDRLAARAAPAPATFDAAELVDVLPPDRIPSIDRPRFDAAAAVDWLAADEPVLAIEVAGDVRAYPLAILVWHEIVNDDVGGTPVVVTYCPLCNSAVVFDRRVDGRAEVFGTSGKLYRSDLVMYDRRTRSLWPQLWGRAVQGPLAGRVLARVPSQVGSLGDFRAAYPSGRVLSRDTGVTRTYGLTPYAGYDAQARPSRGFFARSPDRRLPPMERVVGVAVGDDARAYPYARLGGVLTDRIGGHDVVVLWTPGTRSVLDEAVIARGRAVGSTGVFSPSIDGRTLSFEAVGGGFRDRETASFWSVFGVASAGPLAGRRLEPIGHVDALWFAWAAFVPFTTVSGS